MRQFAKSVRKFGQHAVAHVLLSLAVGLALFAAVFQTVAESILQSGRRLVVDVRWESRQ